MASAHASGGDHVNRVNSPTTSNGRQQSLKTSNGGKSSESARKQTASPVEASGARKHNAPPTRAWQGTNPITSRANSASPQINGTEKTRSPVSPAAQSNRQDPQKDKYAHDKLLFLLANMTGHDATITLKNGDRYAGVFAGGCFDSGKRNTYTMKMVRKFAQSTDTLVNGNVDVSGEYAGAGEDHVQSFDIQDTTDLSVNGVSVSAAKASNGSVQSSSFRTDTEISAQPSGTFRERELQRWEPGPSDMSLDDMAFGESSTNGWDQFAANEQKYGVKSSYDEDIYTTTIDRSHPQYAKRMAEAERMAREIEGSAPADAHVAEERRRDIHALDDGDEEDKYSGVRRDITPLAKGSSGSYVPPSRRPITSQPTVPGAPYDPAIISSQLAKPKSAYQTISTPSTSGVAPGNDENQNISIPSPIPAAKASPNTTEDRVRDTADAFKQFANNEKMRIRQAQEQKRTNARLEKNVRINDLKKFAENFKLKSRVPDDLVPILAKDHEKQVEIKRKADEAARVEEKLRSKDDKSETASNNSPSTNVSKVALPNQPARLRSQPNRSQFVPQLTPGMSPRQAQVFKGLPRQAASTQPTPINLNIPSGPASAISHQGENLASPSPSVRLNVNAKAFEFRPVASNFTPSGTSPSPKRLPSHQTVQDAPISFFTEKEKELMSKSHSKTKEEGTDVLIWLKINGSKGLVEDQKKSLVLNGGIPQPYRTAPTWNVPEDRLNTSYEDAFPRPNVHRPSQMHMPNGMSTSGQHQSLPPNMHGQHGPGSMQNQRYYQQNQPNMQHAQGFDPRLQYPAGPGSSVHNSPRFPQAQISYNGHLNQMQMPQFGGQPMQYPGMSPNMSQRQLHMPQQGNAMQMPGHYGQMRQYPPGPQFAPMPQMAGPMMVPHGSSGPYMNAMPPQSYYPMPPNAQMHMQHMPQHPGNQGFSQSPRPGPHMMHHTTSHQGFQQHQMQMPYVQSGGHPSPYAMNQRQMSAGQFSQATPRQQQAAPVQPVQHVPSPAAGGPAPGQDEGK